jgi:hypothetical protein
MNVHFRELLFTAGALIMTVALPARSTAQTALEPIKVTEARLRAEALDHEAEQYEQTDWGNLKQAARLREDAAELRPAADPKAAVSLYWAARDRYYSEDKVAGRELMERSAERAIAIGDVVGAATAFTEGAYIAAELRDVARTRTLANRAKLLALSPMLSDEQRTQIRARLGSDTMFENLITFTDNGRSPVAR